MKESVIKETAYNICCNNCFPLDPNAIKSENQIISTVETPKSCILSNVASAADDKSAFLYSSILTGNIKQERNSSDCCDCATYRNVQQYNNSFPFTHTIIGANNYDQLEFTKFRTTSSDESAISNKSVSLFDSKFQTDVNTACNVTKNSVGLTSQQCLISSSDIKTENKPDPEICLSMKLDSTPAVSASAPATVGCGDSTAAPSAGLDNCSTSASSAVCDPITPAVDSTDVGTNSTSTSGEFTTVTAGSSAAPVPGEVHKKRKEYLCKDCGKSFDGKSGLQRHVMSHTGERPYVCGTCGCGFVQCSDLTKHMHIHTGAKPFKCDVCGKEFSLKRNLNIHSRVHTGEKPYKCTVCDRGFGQPSTLYKHTRLHSGERPYECKYCNKRFPHRDGLQKHVVVHISEKKFSCDCCKKTFAHSQHLLRHMQSHTGVRQYKCHLCDKDFIQQCHLQNHLMNHTGEKPFHCGECGRTFIQLAHLQRHLKIHTGEKPYTCEVCGRDFATNSDLRKHWRYHTGEKPYTCSLCGRNFAWNSGYKKHMASEAHREKVLSLDAEKEGVSKETE